MNQDKIVNIVFAMIVVTLICTMGTALAVGLTIGCIKETVGEKWRKSKQKINTIFSVIP